MVCQRGAFPNLACMLACRFRYGDGAAGYTAVETRVEVRPSGRQRRVTMRVALGQAVEQVHLLTALRVEYVAKGGGGG